MEDEIAKVIAEYLENTDWVWSLPVNAQPNKIAAEIAEKVLAAMEQKTGWEDAPEWAQYRTTDKHGAVLYWESQPMPDKEARMWVKNYLHSDSKWEYSEHKLDWKSTLEERPK